MSETTRPGTVAERLVRRLCEHGVRDVFGYPGGQLTPLYDALHPQRQAGSALPPIRHLLARHEQAAAFMADGYARATGRPGVCLAVCGPGVFNAFTPLATAYTDSVPLLMISGQVAQTGGVAAGLRSGYYHENEQLAAAVTMTKWRVSVDDGASLVPLLDRAFAEMTTGRPGPVLLEVPVNVLRSEVPGDAIPTVPGLPKPLAPDAAEVDRALRLLGGWQRPLILAGGGVIASGAEKLLAQVAERLGAPVLHTAMGKCALPADHPLAAGLTWHRATSDLSNMANFFTPLLEQADGLLAVGCRFSQLASGSWTMPRPRELVQIDIDSQEIGRHYAVTQGLCADAAVTLRALLEHLPAARPAWSKPPRAPEPWRLPGLDLLVPMRRVLPRAAIVAADITRLGYMMLADFPLYEPRTWLHPAGFVAMGHGLPAALGAKAAFPDRAVVAIAGDGCFQMCGMELATAVQERLPVVTVIVNDGSLTLIKLIQERRYESRFLGVDMVNPDFQALAAAFGVRSWAADSDATFEAALREAIASDRPALVEVRVRG
jgi:thiamine pyrophosphate-dependent acetolactate synthase large subunit-like protein